MKMRKSKVYFNWVHYAYKLAHCCCWSTQNLISCTYRSWSWSIFQSLLPIRIWHTYANKTYHPVVLQIQFWKFMAQSNLWLEKVTTSLSHIAPILNASSTCAQSNEN